MKPAKNPWIKFYTSDWRSDPALRSCTIAARGLWVEMLCIMHEAEPYGSLLIKGKRIDKKLLASLCGIQEKECVVLMLELEGFGVFERDLDGTIYSRRMRRDHAKAQEGRGQVAKKWGGESNDQTRSRRLSDARKKGRHSPQEWQSLLRVCDFKCVRCGADENVPGGLVRDHITPIYQGGSDGIDNIQPLCTKCNSGKGPEAVDYRRHDWEKRLGECLRDVASEMPMETPTQKPEARIDDAVDAREPLVSREAMDLADELLVIAGHNLEFVPPGWCGAGMRVQTWLSNGWAREIIIAAVRGAAARKRGPPANSVQFFENAIAEEVARQSARLPKVEIRETPNLTVTHGTSQNKPGAAEVARRWAEHFESQSGDSFEGNAGAILSLPAR